MTTNNIERPEDYAVDKSPLGPGPWQDEPDRVDFTHAGFRGLILRHPVLGHLCGYVGVPEGHPWHGAAGEQVEAEAHGGLNFAGPCDGHVCHTPEPGEPDRLWWLGFDCAHYTDMCPGLELTIMRLAERHGIDALPEAERAPYRTVAYVREVVQRLCEQAREAQDG